MQKNQKKKHQWDKIQDSDLCQTETLWKRLKQANAL